MKQLDNEKKFSEKCKKQVEFMQLKNKNIITLS